MRKREIHKARREGERVYCVRIQYGVRFCSLCSDCVSDCEWFIFCKSYLPPDFTRGPVNTSNCPKRANSVIFLKDVVCT